jgi:hypothetical protein
LSGRYAERAGARSDRVAVPRRIGSPLMARSPRGRAVALITPRRPPTLAWVPGIRGGWTQRTFDRMPCCVRAPRTPAVSRPKVRRRPRMDKGGNGRAVALPPIQREGSRSRGSRRLVLLRGRACAAGPEHVRSQPEGSTGGGSACDRSRQMPSSTPKGDHRIDATRTHQSRGPRRPPGVYPCHRRDGNAAGLRRRPGGRGCSGQPRRPR